MNWRQGDDVMRGAAPLVSRVLHVRCGSFEERSEHKRKDSALVHCRQHGTAGTGGTCTARPQPFAVAQFAPACASTSPVVGAPGSRDVNAVVASCFNTVPPVPPVPPGPDTPSGRTSRITHATNSPHPNANGAPATGSVLNEAQPIFEARRRQRASDRASHLRQLLSEVPDAPGFRL